MSNGNGLKKSLKLPQVIALAAGGMIAAWMVEIKSWFEWTGSGAFLALCISGLLVLPICFIYAEMTSMLPYAGGENVWASNAFGWNVGWITGWFLLLMYVMAMPTVSYGISSMLNWLLGVELSPLAVKIIAAIILVVWFFLTNYELKFIAKLQSILFWSTLIVSLIASVIFICSGHWSFPRFSGNLFPNGGKGFFAAIALLIMKFVGFDMIPQLAEESDFPKKDMWKAFLGSLLLTILIYGMAVIGVGGIITQEWVTDPSTTIVDPAVADMIGMRWLGVVIVIMGIGTCLTTLSGFWMSASRTLFGAAKQAQYPKQLTKLNKHGQPVLANLIVGILSIFFTVFAPDAWVNYIYVIYGLTAGIVYLIVALSFVKLRISKPHWERPYKIGFLAIPFAIIAIAFCVFIIYQTIITMGKNEWLVMGIYLLIGLGLLIFAKVMQKKNPAEWTMQIPNPETEKIED